MAITLLPKQPSIGELLGTGLGSGVSSGLQNLAQMKMNELQSRTNQQKTYNALLGANYSPDIAKAIATLPSEKMQLEALKNIGSQATANQARAAYGMPTQGTMQQQTGNSFMDKFLTLNPEQQNQIVETIKQMTPEQRQQLSGQLFPELASQQQPTQQEMTQPAQQRMAAQQAQPTGLFSRAETPQQIANLAKYEQKERQIGQKEKALAFKETKATRKDILDSAKADKENKMRIDRMQVLNNEGKLNNPIFYSALKSVGLDIPALLTPESQEFQKLTIDFLKNAKKMFGARITNFEAETFLKSIPSLTQTKEGRDRVIRNLQMLYRGSDLRKNAMQNIIKENNGVPPFDLAEQIEERIDPFLDELAVEFKQGLVEKKKDNSEIITPESSTITPEVEGGGLKEEQSIYNKGETVPGSLLRNTARLTSRGIEAALGLPGDIESSIRAVDTISQLSPLREKYEKAAGIFLDKINPLSSLLKKITGIFPERKGQILPTSEEVKSGISKTIGKILPENYLEPKEGWESFTDNFVSDVIPLLIPVKGKVPFARALKTAGYGNIASFLAKQIGIGEGGQTGVKLGTMLLSSIGNPFSFKNFSKTLSPDKATLFRKEVDQSSKILSFLNKIEIPLIKGLKVNPASALLIGLYSGKLGSPSAVLAGAIYGTGFMERALRMFAKNPELRNSYLQLMKSAAAENAAVTVKNFKKFNNEIEKVTKK